MYVTYIRLNNSLRNMFSHLLFILDGVFFFRNLLHEIIRLERNRTRICHFINKYFVFGSFRVPVPLQSSVLTVHVHFCFTFWVFRTNRCFVVQIFAGSCRFFVRYLSKKKKNFSHSNLHKC